MIEERKMILNMLSEGSITVEEAEKLLETIPDENSNTPTITGAIQPQRIVILVTDGERTKVNMRIPFSLVKMGLKLGKASMALGAKYSSDDESGKQIMELLKDIDIDEVINSINDGDVSLPYVMVDVEDNEKGETIQIILE